MSHTLQAHRRDLKVNPKALRKDGKVPAIVYGPGFETIPVYVAVKDYTKAIARAGEGALFEVKIDEEESF